MDPTAFRGPAFAADSLLDARFWRWHWRLIFCPRDHLVATRGPRFAYCCVAWTQRYL